MNTLQNCVQTAFKPRPAARVNIAINKQIMACEDVGDLCSLIQARVAEFDHVNVATAFCTLLQTRHHGVARGAKEQALRSLEGSALQTIEDFDPQGLANTLHAMAKARYTPTNPLVLEALEQQAEAVAGTMKAQEVANTLWARYCRYEMGPQSVWDVAAGRGRDVFGSTPQCHCVVVVGLCGRRGWTRRPSRGALRRPERCGRVCSLRGHCAHRHVSEYGSLSSLHHAGRGGRVGRGRMDCGETEGQVASVSCGPSDSSASLRSVHLVARNIACVCKRFVVTAPVVTSMTELSNMSQVATARRHARKSSQRGSLSASHTRVLTGKVTMSRNSNLPPPKVNFELDI